MNERQILFGGPMVRAILEGRKTQTRRVIKPQPTDGIVYCNAAPGWAQPYVDGGGKYGPPITCPYGQPGDHLWVRETWNGTQGEGVAYRATNPEMNGEPWRPSIFMPRWASRLTLEITGVRVERVQDISWEDARAEGIVRQFAEASERHGFIQLWNEINAKRGYGWDSNPWVWCISFRRI